MRSTQTVQRPHVRRCGGGGRAQLTHRSDGSAIEPSNTIYTSNQELREITSSDLVALVVFAELVVTMAAQSLLCVNCGAAPPPHRRTWNRCTICVERNLPSTYYCGEECMNAHWPKHQVYHKEQKQMTKERREGTLLEHDRLAAERQARRAERTGDEIQKRCASAMAVKNDGDLHAAAKAWRKIIKEWPTLPEAYFNLAVVLQQSGRDTESSQMYLNAMTLLEEGAEKWAKAAASAFDRLRHPACREAPTPEWWNDEALKALSARVVAVAPDHNQSCAMRGRVLQGGAFCEANWNVGPRRAAEIKEAATWYRRAARVAHVPSDELYYEQLARGCDDFADPLLAKEEADAAKARAAAEYKAGKARAAAEAEAAEALKVAEAKAKAAAEELLAEEEKDKTQAAASTTAKPCRGKKGKGKR